jgi:Copper resistance protein K
MFTKILIVAASSMFALSAFAVDPSNVVKSVELKDGSTVYQFKDGKMGMEDKLGKVVQMKEGHVMETKDGQRVIMVGNEVARMETVLRGAYSGGK